MAMVAGIM